MNSLVAWLSQPDAYADHPATVTLVETHISYVFLTDGFAYKLKKPVRFEFLDFSTVAARRTACQEEVRLNRRLAPDVYLGLAAVRQDEEGKLTLIESASPADLASEQSSSAPPVIDWLVKMRRLPSERTLAELFRAGQLSDADVARLVARLSSFYRAASPLPIEPGQYSAEIERHVRANRAELLGMDSMEHPQTGPDLWPAAVCRVHAAQLQLLLLRPELFEARVRARRIVDGHGDLRPEHIYLLPEPIVIDCIEFSDELRHLDMADELSFLAEECAFIGASDLGRTLAQQVLDGLGDNLPGELLAFYRCYRACVRAKVAALRARQALDQARTQALAEAARHLELADGYTRELAATAPPLLLLVHGLMGSGKSTLAAALADQFGADVLATDAIRREIFGPSSEPAQYNAGPYEPGQRLAIYERLLAAAEQRLRQGIPVVLDGTFLTSQLRRQAADLARRRGARLLAVHCHCPPEESLRRIAARAAAGESLSEARPDLYHRHSAAEEQNPAGLEAIEIDTTTPLADQMAAVLDRLRTQPRL